MSWLSTKWDELTGKNQKVSLGTIDDEYNAAFGTGREQLGFEGEGLGAVGREMMDPNSARNQAAKARMESSGADAAAESSRLAGRNAAMAGGAPAAALAAQTSQGANKAQAGSMDAFNQYLGGQFNSGVGMVSGAANNMTQMNQTQMNAMSNQRQANAQIDSQATGFGANLLGKGLGAMFNPMSAVPGIGGIASGLLPGAGGQRGGAVGYQTGGMPHHRVTGGPRPGEMRARHEQMQREWIARQRDELNNAPMPQAGENVQALRMGQEGYDFEGQPQTQGTSQYSFPSGKFGPIEEHRWNSPDDVPPPQGRQQGGPITPNTGGMLSQIIGPDGIPIHIRTRIGGQTIGQ